MELVVSAITTLLGFVEQAEEQAKQDKGFTQLIGRLSGAQGALSDLFWLSTLEGVEEAETVQAKAVSAHEVLGELVSMAGLSDADRSEGDSLAFRLSGMIAAELFAQGYDLGEWDAAKAQAIVDRWHATAPKKTGSPRLAGSVSSVGDLGFKVIVACHNNQCNGITVASSKKDNLNSLRDQVRKHHGAQHGGKFSRGDVVHTELTGALGKVMGKSDTTTSAEGGGYKVTADGKSVATEAPASTEQGGEKDSNGDAAAA